MSSQKHKFASSLLKISQVRFFQPLVKYFFNHMTNLLPVDKIKENEHWIAFYHPDPDYPLHILILPKQRIRSLSDSPVDAHALYSNLFKIVQELILEFHLTEHGYRLITNGGANQSVPQWHWHLISECVDFTNAPHIV